MKKIKESLLLMLAVVMSAMAMTSCGGDDDGPTPPSYDSEAAKYIASTNSAGIRSFEITPDGKYIIVIIDNQSLRPDDEGDEPALRIGNVTSAADGSLTLIGYGTARISDNNVTLTPTNGQAIVLSVRKAGEFQNSGTTAQMCRGWKTDRLGFGLDKGNNTIFNQIVPVDRTEELIRSFLAVLRTTLGASAPTEAEIQACIKEIREDMPKAVTFTRAGTMLITESDGTYELQTWKWADMTNNVIETADVTIGGGDPDYDTRMAVNISGTQMNLTSMEVENEGQTPLIVSSVIWGFSAI